MIHPLLSATISDDHWFRSLSVTTAHTPLQAYLLHALAPSKPLSSTTSCSQVIVAEYPNQPLSALLHRNERWRTLCGAAHVGLWAVVCGYAQAAINAASALTATNQSAGGSGGGSGGMEDRVQPLTTHPCMCCVFVCLWPLCFHVLMRCCLSVNE